MMIILSISLFIAVIWILTDRMTAWFRKQGGITIRIEMVDENDE
ncbi:MAG: hypothetical protein P9M15_00730 [Candidatus Electryoneaceae bacterium]|nr:hypothetical protein [Candidatus Electryoneaceae bacterium]